MSGVAAQLGEPLAPDDPTSIGRFFLVRRLGQGGMGTAYLATTESDELLVVKTLRADHITEAAFRERFRREVIAASSVRSTFTAKVLASDLEAPTPWVAVQYVPGPTLAELIHARGPLDPQQLTALAVALAEGLAKMHALHLVHRDLKPSNIICSPEGPKLIDFGISEFEHDDLLTIPELGAMGTPEWLAPERLQSNQSPSSAEDIYAWGRVLTYAATGEQQASPTSLANSPLAVALIAATAPDPTRRPTASQLVQRLNASTREETVELVSRTWHLDESLATTIPNQAIATQVLAVLSPGQRRPRRRRSIAIAALAALVFVTAAATWAYVSASGDTDKRAGGLTETPGVTTSTQITPSAKISPTPSPAASTQPSRSPTAADPTSIASRCEELDYPTVFFPGRPLTSDSAEHFSPAVRNVQDNLNYMGYGCLSEDGHFGVETEQAVREFQHDYDLEVDGVVGSKTHDLLTSLAIAGADGCIEPNC